MPLPGKPLPPFEYLNSRFSYDPESGLLFWKAWEGKKSQFNGRYAGTKAGSYGAPYSQVHLDRRMIQTHRIIWKLMTGNDPPDLIDHIDRDPRNNRWSNLRVVTHVQNLWNSRLTRKSKSGYRGAYFIKGKWHAKISVDGQLTHLGCFSTPEEAAQAFEVAAQQIRGSFHQPTCRSTVISPPNNPK